MSLLEELFGADEAEEAEALERVIEGGSDDDEPRGEDEAEEDKRTVDPGKPKSVRMVKNPRVVLNPARLTGPRGIQALPEHFKDFKFKGKGHEKEDLDLVLKKLEHWAHRLYPRFPFDDCLKKIESLGNKRPVKVTLLKIRSDQMVSDEIITQKDSSDDEEPAAPPEDDEFDRLLQQQIELARETQQTPANTPRPMPHSAARTPALVPKATSSPSISEEQKMRMLRNRQLAEERRLQRFKTSAVDLTNFNPAAQLVDANPNGKDNDPKDNISNKWDPKSVDKDIIDISKDPKDTNNVSNNTNDFIDISNSADPAHVIDISNNVDAPNIIDLSNTDPSDCFNITKKSADGSKSVDPKDIIDMTENSNEAAKDSDHVETIDITMIDIDNHGSRNKSNVDNESRNVKSRAYDVDKENVCDVRMQDVEIIDKHEKQNKTNDSSLNGSKEAMSLHYSDSSEDECGVTTFNVSVMADVHRVAASQETVTEIKETNADNLNTDDGNSLNIKDVIQVNEDDGKINRKEDKNKPNGAEVDYMDFEGNDDDWESIDM